MYLVLWNIVLLVTDKTGQKCGPYTTFLFVGQFFNYFFQLINL